MHLERPFPPVNWEIEDPAAVHRRHGDRLGHAETAFPARADCRRIEASRGYLAGDRVDGWVRFPAPIAAVGAPAYARVSMPVATAGPGDRAPMPSVIFAHGIGMEPEYWGVSRDPLNGLAGMGIRIIRPEAPWHGRRRAPGTFGGEPIIARGTGGLLDFFEAAVAEIGQLIAWARATRGGPVAIGGVSLGALTAQLAAVVARHWPRALQPDALLLVAPSRSMTRVVFEGSLSIALGEPQALRAAGWSLADIARWLPLLEPQGLPVVPPERIIVVLGEADDVTLAEGGEALVRDWRVPESNVFRCPAGHFSTSLGLSRDGAPIGRLVSILRRAA
jgi:pimeloyl-ACP methyl ester carboxylesterase